MNINEAVEILRRHNEWRRYNGELGKGPEMVDPKDLGIAIDVVVAHFKGPEKGQKSLYTNNSLKCNNESDKHVVEFLVDGHGVYCDFPLVPDTNYEEEYNDRIHIDGHITFDTMADIVDYLRACNPK